MSRPDCFDFAMDFLGGDDAEHVRAYVELLETQRDQLLAALKSAVETIEWMHGCAAPSDDEVEKVIREGNAAIAAVEQP